MPSTGIPPPAPATAPTKLPIEPMPPNLRLPPPPKPLANTLGAPCATIVQVGSPTLPIGIPSAETLGEPLFNGAVCTQQQTGQAHGNRCGVFLCPTPLMGIPFANTDLKCPALRGGEQWVASLSPNLATAGIRLFIGYEMCVYFLLRRCMASGTRCGFSSHPTTGASIRKYANQ